MKTLIKIELDDYEAEMFKLYQKYHDIFEKLSQVHAFDIEFGRLEMNFAFGELQNIKKEDMVYRKPNKT